ncbi:MAG: transcriptional regulator [Spirochaetaceae bacterium]|jgi:hypothetical protein|nr:transcriptional regulator [Spirochaetaceae bacterium]
MGNNSIMDANSNDMDKALASDDFFRARSRAILSQIRHFLDKDKNRLLSLNDVKEILRPKNETYQGMQAIPINLIVGSEGRYRDFNRYFLPNSDFLRSRWERVDIARIRDIILPPIQLYEIGGVYFVRDGNHRVSVAKTQGTEMIDAEVTSLSSKIPITPGMSADDLKRAVIQYEKDIFYEKTGFAELTEDKDLNFSMPGQYDTIYRHILDHKYFLNENSSREIPFGDALKSWYQEIYEPIVRITREEQLCSRFPGRTESDLYVWIVTHWDFLKKKYGEYDLSDAARDFGDRYGRKESNHHPMASFFRKLFGL